MRPLNADEQSRASRRSTSVLVDDRVVRTQTRTRRDKLLDEFEAWLVVHARTTLASLLEGPYVKAEQISEQLVACEKSCIILERLMGAIKRRLMPWPQRERF